MIINQNSAPQKCSHQQGRSAGNRPPGYQAARSNRFLIWRPFLEHLGPRQRQSNQGARATAKVAMKMSLGPRSINSSSQEAKSTSENAQLTKINSVSETPPGRVDSPCLDDRSQLRGKLMDSREVEPFGLCGSYRYPDMRNRKGLNSKCATGRLLWEQMCYFNNFHL